MKKPDLMHLTSYNERFRCDYWHPVKLNWETWGHYHTVDELKAKVGMEGLSTVYRIVKLVSEVIEVSRYGGGQ